MALVESASYSPHSSTYHGPRGSDVLRPILSYAAPRCEKNIKRISRSEFSLDSQLEGIDGLGSLGCLVSMGLTLEDDHQGLDDALSHGHNLGRDHLPEDSENIRRDLHPRRPFKKWMRSLHRRAAQRSSIRRHYHRPHWRATDSADLDDHFPSPSLRRRTSSSGSSFGFVAAVKSASVSLASVSSVTRSRRNATRSKAFSKTDRSSRASMSAARISEDSIAVDKALMRHDAAAMERAMQRRRILEEIISTEEGYIGDLRFLINVYVTIFASLPSQAVGLRSSINRNLTDIIGLHEEILGELHRIVPHSEYHQSDALLAAPTLTASTSQSSTRTLGHRRWRSLDAVPEHGNTMLLGHEASGLLADSQVAADVARVFGKRMNRFFIYKEYGTKYDLMTADIGSVSSTIPDWNLYQKGLEALASTLGPAKSSTDMLKRSLTLGDLLMKPIQRICKYPLLFSELLKYTTVVDSPNANMEVESALTRLREATSEINRATDDAHVRATLEKTWLLQDRLVFLRRELDAVTRTKIRSFGRIQLCGALHICWQEQTKIEGQYMICLLYQDVLCLALAGRVDPIYTIMACINLQDAKIEDADNGRGLQCHSAPFSWKVSFECDCEMYELLFTACSAKEEEEWRSRLSRGVKSPCESRNGSVFSSTDLPLKSLGTVFGKQGQVVRPPPISRAVTVNPKTPVYQVVLKNTSAFRDGPSASSTSSSIQRSQSLLTTNSRIPVLAPARTERARLESLLTDVWSRDVLPFPGISARPGTGHLVRASTMMRKLSVANLTESLNKRSGSVSRRPARLSEDELDMQYQRSDSIGAEPDILPMVLSKDEPATSVISKVPSVEEEPESAAQEDEAAGEESGGPNDSPRKRKTNDDEIEGLGPQGRAAEDPGTEPVLRKSSGNNTRLALSKEAELTSSQALEKETTCVSPECSKRLAGRWTRVGHTGKGDGKIHGLRSLFR